MFGALLSISSLAGCASNTSRKREYTERISSVYLTGDAKQMVIIGVDYHYIFDAPPVIANTINSEFQPYVEASFGNFDVHSSHNIQGAFGLKLRDDAPDNLKDQALQAGYYRRASDGAIIAAGPIKGKRYSAPPNKDFGHTASLNRTHEIKVTDWSSTRGKSPSSPVSKTAEGILVIGALPLILVVMVVMYYGCLFRRCKK